MTGKNSYLNSSALDAATFCLLISLIKLHDVVGFQTSFCFLRHIVRQCSVPPSHLAGSSNELPVRKTQLRESTLLSSTWDGSVPPNSQVTEQEVLPGEDAPNSEARKVTTVSQAKHLSEVSSILDSTDNKTAFTTINKQSNGFNKNETSPEPESGHDSSATICQIVAEGDGMLPNNLRSALNVNGTEGRLSGVSYDLLDKLESIFYSMTRVDRRFFSYFENGNNNNGVHKKIKDHKHASEDQIKRERIPTEREAISLLRSTLSEAGFVLLNQRDWDLCEALNAGYLLRLSIVPNTKRLSADVGPAFFPELHKTIDNHRATNKGKRGPGRIFSLEEDEDEKVAKKVQPKEEKDPPLLLDGKVLVFRRGYSEEVTEGRLLLPKLDYLQATIVQRSAMQLVSTASKFERSMVAEVEHLWQSFSKSVRSYVQETLEASVFRRFARDNNIVKEEGAEGTYQVTKVSGDGMKNDMAKSKSGAITETKSKLIKLTRYGGWRRRVATDSSNDPLSPFVFLEDRFEGNDAPVLDDESVPTAGYPNGTFACDQFLCEYDREKANAEAPTVDAVDSTTAGTTTRRRLVRVGISNVFDFSTRKGRRRLVRNFFSKSKLVEPTYEEVVVIWRPSPKPLGKKTEKKKKKIFGLAITPPDFVYEVADMFGFDDRLPPKPSKSLKSPQAPTRNTAASPLPPIEVRVFKGVQMSNLPAVLPETKLIFRPADAFVFDLITVFSFAAVVATQRFDNPKLDLIALVSATVWLLRTVFRYSNKLARYDLLVKKFLTSKLAQRGAGALRYIATESGYQRAMRAGLLFSWMTRKKQVAADGSEGESEALSNSHVLAKGSEGVNSILKIDGDVTVDVASTLKDLKNVGLIESDSDPILKPTKDVSTALRKKWVSIFDEDDKS